MARSNILFGLVAVLLTTFWLVLLGIDPDLAVDYTPLHIATTRVLAGNSPYGAAATADLMAQWPAPFAAAGVAYPLPVLLFMIPLVALPLAVAAMIWTVAGTLLSLSAIRLQVAPRYTLLLPLLFMPFHRSVVLGQATLLWFGFATLLLFAMRQRRPWAVGILIVLLLLKPQNGVLFSIAGLVWGLVEQRRALWWCVLFGGCLGAISLLVQPGWIGEWIAQVQLYNTIVRPPTLLPWGILVLAACWRLPWWGLVAAAQVVLFPITDFYSALPILLCWIAIGDRHALVGAGCSWIGIITGRPNDLQNYILFLIVPVCVVSIARFWLKRPQHEGEHAAGPPPMVNTSPTLAELARQWITAQRIAARA